MWGEVEEAEEEYDTKSDWQGNTTYYRTSTQSQNSVKCQKNIMSVEECTCYCVNAHTLSGSRYTPAIKQNKIQLQSGKTLKIKILSKKKKSPLSSH